MPKDTRSPCSSLTRFRASPYHCSPKDRRQFRLGNSEGSAKDVHEWEEARCPICMEPPHNAVLLRCSSYEKGCRPYMCDTSYRHSNCLDQFSKTGGSPSDSVSRWRREEIVLPGQTRFLGRQMQSQVACPLCRGQVYGIVVIEPAREYMNSKRRICSCETCEFTGTYSELRKHARSEHPAIYPSKVDPTRQDDWSRLEWETEVHDLLCIFEPSFAGENIEGSALPLYNMSSFLALNRSRILSLVEFALMYMELFPESYMPQYSSSIQEILEGIALMDACFMANDPVTALRRMYEWETSFRARGRFDWNADPITRVRMDDRQNHVTHAQSTSPIFSNSNLPAGAQPRNGTETCLAGGIVSGATPATPTRGQLTGRQVSGRQEMAPPGIARFRYSGRRSTENTPHFGQEFWQNQRS